MSDLILDQNAPEPQNEAAAKPALDLGPGQPASLQAVNPADLIKDTDTQNFARDVIEASAVTPVIVDFWAPWCGPCKTLGPMLEKMVKRAGGLVKMVKINVDENQGLAGQLRVQSVPTVFAFKDGQPVDAFAGALPESQIKAFIDKLLGDAKSPVDDLMEQAQDALKSGDGLTAEQLYTGVLSQDPTMIPAFAGILRAIALQGDVDRARDMLDALDAKTLASSDVQQAISALDLAEESQNTDSAATAELEQRVADNPKDLDARFELAQAQFAAGQTEPAIDNLLEIVSIDRAWNEEAGRKQLLKIFDTIGAMDPVTVDARKRLSAILFS
ncbi:thioredoxin [Magnetovibrio sp. PR-2]|uniref:thioredoxin n=1 Tax=Magnetovibrio sp. PR-2 TaxID=3120356 RepID=UPI002FCE039E